MADSPPTVEREYRRLLLALVVVAMLLAFVLWLQVGQQREPEPRPPQAQAVLPQTAHQSGWCVSIGR